MTYSRYVMVLVLLMVIPQSQAESGREAEQESRNCEAMMAGKFTETMKKAIVLSHYCRCINYYERARKNKNNKGNLVTAYNNCRYTINHANLSTEAGKKAVSEVLIQQGKVQKARGLNQEAIENFKKSIELNPSNPSGYAKLSDIYLRSGKKDLAIWMLEEGLKKSPDSRALRRRLERASR